MIRILVADDEEPIAKLVRLSLRKAGYSCDAVYDGQQVIDKLDSEAYDLIILDVMMPDMDGFELMDYIRPLGIPVIYLTARDKLDDKVHGLRIGAEDYIVKPFQVAELIARVEVVLRRYHKTDTVLRYRDLTVDTISMKVERGGTEISLTPKEYEILLLFLRTPNTALFRETIYERVWGGEMEYGSKTVDLHVQRLRKKTGLESEIKAISKIGYRFEMSGEPDEISD